MPAIYDKDIPGAQRIRDVSRSFTVARALETPFSTMVKKGDQPKSSLYEWPFRQRPTPTNVGIADGQDVTAADVGNNEALKCMLQGRTQKGWVAYGVGDVAQSLVNEYGISNLMADNAQDAMGQAKENLELMFLSNTDSRAETGATSATSALLRGLTQWVRTTAGTDLPINAMALTPAGNIVTGKATADLITEDEFRGVMQSIATACRKTNNTWDVFLSPLAKQTFSNYIRTATVNQAAPASTVVPLRSFNADQKDGKITLNVTFYESDFGLLRLQPHFSLPSGVHALIVDMDSVKARPLRAPREWDLPFMGGTNQSVIDYIFGLEVSNPRAHGKITT